MTGSLEGARVVVTRSRDDAGVMVRSLGELGATVIALPAIEIVFPSEHLVAARDVMSKLAAGGFEWLLLSSRAGVAALHAALSRNDIQDDVLATVRVGAVGKATAEGLREIFERDADVVPERFTGADLARALGAGTGAVLLVRPERAPRVIADDLGRSGWDVREVALYRTERGSPPAAAIEAVRRGDFDAVTFTSGSTVRFFTEILGPPSSLGLDKPDPPHVVVIGPSTADVARDLGFHVDRIAAPHTTEGVVEAVAATVGR